MSTSPLPHPGSSMSLPGHSSPQAGFEEPFELLSACHERIERCLALLVALEHHLDEYGHDAQSAQAAHDVIRYFDLAAPLHHEDEERHVFSALLATGDAEQQALVHRLQQDHVTMKAAWVSLRPALLALAEPAPGAAPGLDAEARAAIGRFKALHTHHIEDEERLAFPAVHLSMNEEALQAMSADMMARRGVKGFAEVDVP